LCSCQQINDMSSTRRKRKCWWKDERRGREKYLQRWGNVVNGGRRDASHGSRPQKLPDRRERFPGVRCIQELAKKGSPKNENARSEVFKRVERHWQSRVKEKRETRREKGGTNVVAPDRRPSEVRETVLGKGGKSVLEVLGDPNRRHRWGTGLNSMG